MIRADKALYKLLNDYEFNSVLDIGCGEGLHSNIFLNNGKKVTAIDYGKSFYYDNNTYKSDVITADFNTYKFDRQFDCIWCSHILEHQRNPGMFLDKIKSLLKENGVLAITVPPYKSEIVGGHISFWNVGLLLYNLVIAGFDCSNAIASKYKYNISVIVKNISLFEKLNLIYDSGDITSILIYLPSDLQFIYGRKDFSFNGNIENINWD